MERSGIKNAEDELKKINAQIEALEKKMLKVAGWDTPDAPTGEGDNPPPVVQENLKEIEKLIAALEQEAATYGKTAEQVALYKLALLGANEEQLKAAQAAIKTTTAKREQEQATKDQAEAAEAEAKALEDLAEAISKTSAANQNYLDAAGKLHDELASGAITYDEYTKAMDKLDKGDQFKGLADKGDEAMQRLESATRGWGEQFTNTLADMVQSGKLSFSELADSIISDLLRIMIYQNITAPLFGGLGIPGFSAPTNHTGGIAGLSGGSKMVNPAVFLGSPRLHYGGIAGLASNEVPTILEKGEEVLTTDDPRHRWNQSGSGNVRVDIVKNGTPIETDSASAQFDAEGMVVQVILNDYQRGGPISQRMGKR